MAAAYSALSEALRFAWAVGPQLFVAASLEGLASIEIARGEAQRAISILAAAAALRVRMNTSVRPVDQATVEQALAAARSTLGDNAFAAAWTEVQSLPLEQILNSLPSVAAFTAVRDRSET